MPLSAPSRRAAPSWPVLTSKAGGTVSYLLCVQPAHRYWRRREDGADSGGAEVEDECAEEAPGLLCLHFCGEHLARAYRRAGLVTAGTGASQSSASQGLRVREVTEGERCSGAERATRGHRKRIVRSGRI